MARMIPSLKKKNFSAKEEAIYRNNVGANLDYNLAREAFREILSINDDNIRYVYMGMLLNASVYRGLQPEVVKGFLDAAFELDNFNPQNKLQVSFKDAKERKVVALAGSGKKGLKTFNITSASLFVAADEDFLIAKASSSATSSVTGSSDFISAVGANINIPLNEMIDIMVNTGVGFFSIEHIIPKFDAIYGGRFFAPHALSFALAGLINPIRPDFLIYGLAHPNITLSLKVFKLYALSDVLCLTSSPDGIHYVDDLLPFGNAIIQGYNNGGDIGRYKSFNITEILNLSHYTYSMVAQGTNKKDNILISIRAIQNKGPKAVIDTVAVNAATILYVMGKANNLIDGYNIALHNIKTGKAVETLRRFIKVTGGDLSRLEMYLKES